MSAIISVNTLEGFIAPTMVYKFAMGAASKTHTMRLPASPYNVVALGGQQRQRATMTVGGVTLIGWLLVVGEDRKLGIIDLIFVTGNGDLWQRKINDKLSDVNLSEFDFVYNRSTVNNSETRANPFVLFDIADRGAFRSTSAIDITERYPAIHIATLTSRVLKHLGTSPLFEDRRGDFSDLYLLFTNNNEINNTPDWQRDASMVAYDLRIDTHNNTQAAGVMVWDFIPPITETLDVGGNYTNGVYLVPQDGTYSFKLKVGRVLGTFNDNFFEPALLSYGGNDYQARLTLSIERNGSPIARWMEVVATDKLDVPAKQINLHPIELTNGDEINVRVILEATVSFPFGGTQSRFTLEMERVEFSNSASRWYGSGSNVKISDILPDLTISDYLRLLVESLGIEIVHDQLAGRTYVIYGGVDQTPAAKIEDYERLTIDNEPAANIKLIYKTDKAAPKPNEAYIVGDSAEVEEYSVNLSRTLIARCGRLLGYNYGIEVPILWQAGNPLDEYQSMSPPAFQTLANLRILRRLPNTSSGVNYVQTFAGSVAQTEEVKTTLVRFDEPDIWQLLAPRLARKRQSIEVVARVDVSALVSGAWFRRPIHVAGMLIQVVEAEQLDGDVFKIRGNVFDYNEKIIRGKIPITSLPDTTPRGGAGDTAPAPIGVELWTPEGNAGMVTGRYVQINNNHPAGALQITGERPVTVYPSSTFPFKTAFRSSALYSSFSGAERNAIQLHMTDGNNHLQAAVSLGVNGYTTPYLPWLIFSVGGYERASIRENDLHIHANGAGIVLRSPSGNSFRITVDNHGNLISTMI